MPRGTNSNLNELLSKDKDLLRSLVREAVQQVLEAEMTEVVGADRSERTSERKGYRSGYYGRGLVTRVGLLELRVPRDRAGQFRIRCTSAVFQSAPTDRRLRPWQTQQRGSAARRSGGRAASRRGSSPAVAGSRLRR